jgi:PST family polysaccharide transporter
MRNNSKINYNQYLLNEDLKKNLREKTLFGIAAVVSSNGVRFVIQICGTIVLARILFPEDFGLIAMVTALTSFFDVFKDAGLSMATVQREEITHEQVSTLFWIIIFISFLIMLFVMASSPFIAWFYGEQRLIRITLLISFSILLGGLGIQHRALLRRRMSFKRIALTDITAQFLSTMLGVCLALVGAGYWALVGIHAVRPLIATIFLWTLCPWRPGLPKRRTGVAKMIAFGGHLSFSRIMGYLTKNFDNILIGSLIGSYALGLYSKAYSLMMLPLRQINLPITNTIMSALSRLQNDQASYKNYFKNALSISNSVIMPISVFSLIAAKEIILIFLGNRWEGVIPILQALIPAAFLYPIATATGWSLIPLGKTKAFMNLSFINAITTIIAFLIGISWGALGVAFALSTQAIVIRPITLWYSVRNSIITYSDYFLAIYRPFIASIIAGIFLWKFKIFLTNNNILFTLLYFIIAYFTLYFVIRIIIFGGKKDIKAMLHYLNLIKSNIPVIK